MMITCWTKFCKWIELQRNFLFHYSWFKKLVTFSFVFESSYLSPFYLGFSTDPKSLALVAKVHAADKKKKEGGHMSQRLAPSMSIVFLWSDWMQFDCSLELEKLFSCPFYSKHEDFKFECSISILERKFGMFIWFSHCWAIFQLDGHWLFSPAIFRPSSQRAIIFLLWWVGFSYFSGS